MPIDSPFSPLGSVPWRKIVAQETGGTLEEDISGVWGNYGVLTGIDIGLIAAASGDDIDYNIWITTVLSVQCPLIAGHILTDGFANGGTQWRGWLPLSITDTINIRMAHTSGTIYQTAFTFSGFVLEPMGTFNVE